MKYSMGQDKDRGITHPLVTSAKQTELRDDQINFRKKYKMVRNKIKTPSPKLCFLLKLNFTPSFPALPPPLRVPKQCRGMGVMVSPYPVFCAVPSFSPFPLLHHGPFLQDTDPTWVTHWPQLLPEKLLIHGLPMAAASSKAYLPAVGRGVHGWMFSPACSSTGCRESSV